MTEFGLNAVGNTLILTLLEDGLAKDISTATPTKFLIKKPDLTTSEVSAGFVTDGTDGQLQYTFISGDLNIEGQYELQAQVTAGAWRGTSSSFKFEVRDTIVI